MEIGDGVRWKSGEYSRQKEDPKARDDEACPGTKSNSSLLESDVMGEELEGVWSVESGRCNGR